MITTTITIISSIAVSFWAGRQFGFSRGRQEGYDTGYRDGRISCARNKRAESTPRKAVRKDANRADSEEEAVQWMG